MKRIFLLIPLFLILIGCTSKVTEEDLIGGTWVATTGYKDGKASGEPNCHPFEDGMEFKNDDTVYNAIYESDFEYWLYEVEGDSIIYFAEPTPGFSYQIKKISEDEIVLEGLESDMSKGNSCYLERK